VWIIVYALLGFTGFFKTQQHLRGLIAIMAALLTLASPKVLMVVSLIVPWFSILFVFIAMMLLGIMIFGVKAETITKWVEEKDNATVNFVIIIAAIIFVAGLGFVFFSDGGAPATNEGQIIIDQDGNTITTYDQEGNVIMPGSVGERGQSALMATLFHPKVLGAVFVLLLGLFTVMLLVK
jgi:hypothetical protein